MASPLNNGQRLWLEALSFVVNKEFSLVGGYGNYVSLFLVIIHECGFSGY
jgi:hypothetical protein